MVTSATANLVDGEEIQCKYHAPFTSRAARDMIFEKVIEHFKQQNLINIQGWTIFTLNWQKVKTKNTRLIFKKIHCFGLQYTTIFFNQFVTRFKHGTSYRGWNIVEMIWWEKKLLRVSGEFELPRVQVIGCRLYIMLRLNFMTSNAERTYFGRVQNRIQDYRSYGFFTFNKRFTTV